MHFSLTKQFVLHTIIWIYYEWVSSMKCIYLVFYLICMLLTAGCGKGFKQNEIRFATFAEYPPFEYSEHGEIKGFDIDLARLVAKALGKTAVFDNIQFSTILPAITSDQDDAAIATLTITPDRQKNFDFTMPYYFEGMSVLYKIHQPIHHVAQLEGKKIAAQLGSVMEIWLRKHFPAKAITSLNTNNQTVEALIAGHVDVVLMDGAQAVVYSHKHPGLESTVITKAEAGYGIALKKGSPLTAQINQALKKLKAQGEIEKLKAKWLEGASWKH
jgi:polar amino acid transport system substrate-binding protein